MPIEGFDYKLFAKQLADQVGPALPEDIIDADKQYVVNIVYNFCFMAGEALANEPETPFDANQAAMVTQFIGEWTFHKSVDIIRAGIDPQFRETILQKIAFTVFEIAKTAIMKNAPHADLLAIVEYHVKKSYTDKLEELKSKGAISEEQFNNAINQSNIDKMAKDTAEQEFAQENQQSDDNYINNTNDTKLLKLATFAIVLKYLPAEKQQTLLKRFSPNDAQILHEYSQIHGLEEQLDKNVVMKCLKEIKNTLPESKIVNPEKVYQRLYKIVKNSDFVKISNMMLKERNVVRDFVSSPNTGRNVNMPPRIADIICEHIEEKILR